MPNIKISDAQKSTSKELRGKKSSSVRSTGIYRESLKLATHLFQIRKTCPVWARPQMDVCQLGMMQLIQTLSLAFADMDSRVYHLEVVTACLDTAISTLSILKTGGCLSNDDYNKGCSLVDSCRKQALRWRNASMVRFSQGSHKSKD